MSVKTLLKPFIPPLILNLVDKISHRNIYFKGNFSNWQEARNNSTGFDNPAIFERVKSSAKKVNEGSAAYERDSILFDKVSYSWPLLACLQNVAINNSNKLHLIDFGGSLGTSYYQNRSFLQQLDSIRWYIVEQPHFVECGKKEFETDVLKFSNSIEEILAIEKPACLLASGVVQCLEDPFSWIQKVLDFDFEYIILDRTCFIEGIKRLTIEVVPSSVYPASFPCWFLNEAELLSLFANSYELIADFESVDGETVTKDNKRIYWKGFLWKKKR